MVKNMAIPLAICIIANVVMNEGSPNLVVTIPLTHPRQIPASKAMITPTQPGNLALISRNDAITPVMVAMLAMLRSISPASNTKVTPMASRDRAAACCRMLRKLMTVRKRPPSEKMEKKIIKAARVTKGARKRPLTLSQRAKPFFLAWAEPAVGFVDMLSSKSPILSGVLHESVFGQAIIDEFFGDSSLGHNEDAIAVPKHNLGF